jgi:peroxiredoxin
LRQNIEKIQSLDTQVVAISFGSPSWACAWLDETNAPFPLLLDLAQTAYHAYGLLYSLSRSWGPKTFLLYARLLLSGRRWRGIQGDSGQLGGDFVVDRNGVVRLAYRSHDPTDRPAIDQIVRCLEELNPGQSV